MKGKVKITVEWVDERGKKKDTIDSSIIHGLIGVLERRFKEVEIRPSDQVIILEAQGGKS